MHLYEPRSRLDIVEVYLPLTGGSPAGTLASVPDAEGATEGASEAEREGAAEPARERAGADATEVPSELARGGASEGVGDGAGENAGEGASGLAGGGAPGSWRPCAQAEQPALHLTLMLSPTSGPWSQSA